MILRFSTAAARGAVAVVAAVCFLFLAFFSIRDALAGYYASQQALEGLSRAARLEPSNPDHWFALGRYWQYNLESQDLDRAVPAYRASLLVDPRSSDAWLDLAAAYEALGNLAEARAAFANAKRVYPLSAQVAWSYGNFLLRQGDLNAAFPEIRRAVVADPSRGAEAFSRCIRVEPGVETVLDRVIPPARDAYLEIMRGLSDDGQTADALRVWDRLVRLGPPLRLRDVQPLIDSLRRKRLIQDASAVWQQAAALSGFADLQAPTGSVLWDGGFESGETGLPYTWTFSPNSHGVQTHIDSGEKHSGSHALRVTFDGQSNVNFLDVCHLAPLSPATAFRFSAWVYARDLSTDQGVHFVLYGVGGVEAAPLTTQDVRGSPDWRQIAIDWTAPAGSTEARVCLARLPSDQPDNKIRGTVWLDDVALVPLTPANRKP
jgi:tetratricopeptide (TPR) repeat protein